MVFPGSRELCWSFFWQISLTVRKSLNKAFSQKNTFMIDI